MNVADFIVRGLELEIPDNLSRYVYRELDTTCAVTGAHITEGIPWKRVIPSSTGEYLDLMHGMTFEYMGIPAAIAFKGSWNMGSRLIFEDGTMFHPYIAASSAAKNERTYWSSLVRYVWPARQGQRCLCIVAGDFKKRVWPRAAVGELGDSTLVYVLDPDRLVSQLLTINWPLLISTLDFIEEVYTRGFSKNAITRNLLSHYSGFSENPELALVWEERLQELRPTSEFTVSILIAQKKE